MGTELAGLIRADLAALTNDASRLAVAPALDAAQLTQDSTSGNFSFAQSMKNALASVDGEERAAMEKMAAVDSGNSDDLVGAMLSSQQANLSFSMLMQVRNKVMGAVDELLKLPV
jgi:flagellar hook-basal body complex protein FliE